MLIYEVALSRVQIIEKKCNVFVRKWLGLPRIQNSAALYRKKGSLQLPLTSLVGIYKKGKVRTVMMLRESRDELVKKDPPCVKSARKWKAEKEVDSILSELKHRDMVGAAQKDRRGLGFGSDSFKPFFKMSTQERRRVVGEAIGKREADMRELHLVQCSQQGQLTKWDELVVERKIGWQEIWRWTASRLSFLIRSTYDTLPSPSNLVRWKVAESDRCRCGKQGTLKHILSNCSLALERYTWRHNLVLKVLFEAAEAQLEKTNKGIWSLHPQTGDFIKFVTPGEKAPMRKRRFTHSQRWEGYWEISADLPGKRFVSPILHNKKLDLVLWCEAQQRIELAELTVCHEENFLSARDHKTNKYSQLKEELINAGFETSFHSIEVGCRGYANFSVKKWLKSLEIEEKVCRSLIKKIEELTERASHWIWLKREDDTWLEK
ncbi:hypothetical protein Ahia01_000094300 [Argonauta hians]